MRAGSEQGLIRRQRGGLRGLLYGLLNGLHLHGLSRADLLHRNGLQQSKGRGSTGDKKPKQRLSVQMNKTETKLQRANKQQQNALAVGEDRQQRKQRSQCQKKPNGRKLRPENIHTACRWFCLYMRLRSCSTWLHRRTPNISAAQQQRQQSAIRTLGTQYRATRKRSRTCRRTHRRESHRRWAEGDCNTEETQQIVTTHKNINNQRVNRSMQLITRQITQHKPEK